MMLNVCSVVVVAAAAVAAGSALSPPDMAKLNKFRPIDLAHRCC